MKRVLFHANCPDGFGAAFAAWKRMGFTNVEYIPVYHGDPLPDHFEDGDEIFILDFAYSEQVLTDLARKCTVKVLDHHKTAMDALAHLPFATFDLNKSGAVLAWEYFHASEPPVLLKYVQDRDLWQWKLEHSRQICAGLDLVPMVFTSWDRYLNDVDELRKPGSVVEEFKRIQVERAMQHTQWREVQGYRVPVVNCTFMAEMAMALCVEHPYAAFAASYFDRGDGTRQWSLRSVGDFDVSEIAKHYGGGGHKNAAGFEER